MILCRIRHAWSAWREELYECPDGLLMTIAVRRRDCRRCYLIDEQERVLSCVSS